ncbi:MAG: hypothetical protein JW870_09280, partial [Candidatus Delongbacteria bacterium]|nr:hypothetical protein [Candidatus Delongbacteria bacterium]
MISIHRKGKELSEIELKVINEARINAFNSKRIIAPTKGDQEWDKDFFLILVNRKIVSIGCLEAVTVKVNSIQFSILGISRIIAIEEGKGFGRAVMDSIKNYLVENDKIGMGFCNPSKSMFYSKCGYTIMPNAQNNFEYFE